MHVLARLGGGLAIASLVSSGAGCVSSQVNLSPVPPEHYEKLGRADAEVCGDLFLILPWHQFIPWGLNERVERAYAGAVSSADGATGLVNVTLSERWYWWGLATRRCTRIQGDAIR